MPEIVYYVASSLDGFIATPDGGVGWLSPFESTGEDCGYSEFYQSIDAVLIGRKTFEQAAMFPEWPYPDRPCWVFSRRPIPISRPDVVVTARGPLEVLPDLEARGCRRAWLVGGGELAAAFRAPGLITEYVVSIIPVVLGEGVPLFGAHGPVERLRLVESKTYALGVVQLRYKPAT